jgi:hypothetical protein
MDSCVPVATGDYLFHLLPQAVIQDLIFAEMLNLGDIARLEVAAADHRIHQSQVSDCSFTGMMHKPIFSVVNAYIFVFITGILRYQLV